MKTFFFAVGVLGALIALFMPKTEAAAGDIILRVATYNIDAKSCPDIIAQRKLLAENRIEVAGLQEVDRNTRRNPKDMPAWFGQKPYRDVFFGKAIDFAGGEYGICLISTHALISKSVRRLNSGAAEQRVYQRALIEKDGRKVAIYNTHLSWESQKIRHEQLQTLKRALDADQAPYKILLGDLNVDQSHRELALFQRDYRLANGKDGVWQDTFHGGDPAMKVLSIDHIIVSKNMVIRAVKVIASELSDHDIWYAELKLL